MRDRPQTTKSATFADAAAQAEAPPAGSPRSLLCHSGALGDWLVTFTLLGQMPRPCLAWTSLEKARLAARLLPGVLPLQGEAGLGHLLYVAGGAGRLPALWRGQLAELELVISFVAGPAGPWADNMRQLAPRARLLFVEPRPAADFAGHVTQWHRQQLAQQGLNLPEVSVEQTPLPPRAWPLPSATAPLVIHPGSGGQGKCWPRQRFAQLIDELEARGIPCQALLGEVEAQRWPAEELALWQSRYQARLCPTLDELLAALLGSRGLIGNDSGPAHLAGLLALPTLVLFGPSDPRQWRPLGPRVQVLAPEKPGPVAQWEPSAVAAAACALLRLGQGPGQ